MPTRASILTALQFDHIQRYLPINTAADGRYQLSYQFAGNSQPGDALWSYTGWTAYTAQQKNIVRNALAHIETFLNVDFVEVTNRADPDINFGRADLGPGISGEAGCRVAGPLSNPRWDAQVMYDTGFDMSGSDGAYVVLHEIGHALGLDHPFEGATLPAAYDNTHFTTMSYDIDPHSGSYNNAMMLYDLLALQDIWGRHAFATGNTTYTGPGSADVKVVWDTRGIDTFSAADLDHGVRLDLRVGEFSRFGSYEDVVIAYGVRIENAIGGPGHDLLRGNTGHNSLIGNNGNDRMFGFAGADRLSGNGGRDRLDGGPGNDRLLGGIGNDTLLGRANRDRLAGHPGADTLRGGSGLDWLNGGSGNDRLFGGGHADTLIGHSGNDRLVGGGGRDRLFGGDGDDLLVGGAGFDRLWGRAGADEFLFRPGVDRELVLDFEDDIDSLRVVNFGSRAQVLNAAETVDGDTYFSFGDDVLIIRDVTLGQLSNDLSVA